MPQQTHSSALCSKAVPSTLKALTVSAGREEKSALATALLVALALPLTAVAQEDTGILTDWQTRATLSADAQEQLPAACCGMFVEPARDGEFADQDPELSPTEIETPDPVRQPEPSQLYVDGRVSVQQGYRTLSADQGLHLDETTNILTLQGDVLFREPGFLVTGQGARIDQNNGVNEVERASYVIHDSQIHGSATQLSYKSDSGMLTLENGEFSRCEPLDPFWVMQARGLRLDNARGVGYANDVTLRIRDVPVFYYPYTLQFPISDQRVSGVLPPSLSNSRDGGVDLAVPYYFNLAPHYDATLTPRIITKRGAMLSAELRYLASWSMNTVNLALLPKDRTFDPARAESPGSDTPPREKRWFTGMQHEGQLGDSWRTFVDFNAVSDADYFRDLGSSDFNLESRTHLNKEGVLSWQNESLRADARVQRIEIIDSYIASIDINKPFDRLPELSLRGDYRTADRLRYGFNTSHVSFDRSLNASLLSDDQVNRGALVTGQRFVAEPYISLPVRRPGWFVVPTARYRYASWELDDQANATDATPDRGIGVFSLDSGLVFERPVSFANDSMTQTLEPRLYYLYSEYAEQQTIPTFDTAQLNFNFNQLFRDDRFSGPDRVGDANQISAAVTSRFIGSNGIERARFSAGQIFYFENRKISLNSPLQNWLLLQPLDTERSALVLETEIQPREGLRFMADLQWDQENSNIDEGSIAVQYQAANDALFNAAFRYRERTDVFLDAPPLLDARIKQTDLSAVWPLNDNWRLLGRWNYDHSNSRNLETFGGVEYSNCCATMRLIARDWVNDYEFFEQNTRQNRGIFFQLSLHGLGDLTGGGLGNLLRNSIPGFKEQDVNE